ncbi:MAG TPA: hypothetical protein PK410_00790, partial [Paludibacteraceae bacterium]|nr:hypothetical protein [Paludibacteraceae bacterium]
MAKPPKSIRVNWQHNLTKKETKVYLKLIIMLLMEYKQLTSERRYAIYLDIKEGTSKTEVNCTSIAAISSNTVKDLWV